MQSEEWSVINFISFNAVLTNKEGQKQFLFQVVEEHHQQYPDSNKKRFKILTFFLFVVILIFITILFLM